ncbi:MAG: glycosyltransferase, partial [Acidimicrobiales bacterium]
GMDDLLVCSFGIVAPTKLSHHLLHAFTSLDASQQAKIHLAFVGGRFDDAYTSNLDEQIESAVRAGWDVRCTGWVTRETYEYYLASADMAVQLRTDSRGESSRTILDCLAYGIPTIINTHGPAGELPGNVVMKLPDDFSREELSCFLSTLLADEEGRATLARDAVAYIGSAHSPDRAATLYYQAIESIYENDLSQHSGHTISRLAEVARQTKPRDKDLLDACLSMAANKQQYRKRQLLVDLSAIVEHDLRTGIERVSRAVLYESFRCPGLSSFRVEPVHCVRSVRSVPDSNHGPCYAYARKFTSNFLGADDSWAKDSAVNFSSGDVFFGLDWAADKVPTMEPALMDMRDSGVSIFFFIHDILPVLHPEWFPPEMESIVNCWFQAVYEVSDGVICNSRATARAVLEWVDTAGIARQRPLRIGYCYLGADLESSLPTTGLSPQLETALPDLAKRITFLSVGTLEPRKGHDQILSAFDMLWEEGHEVNLVVIGKQGWMVDGVIRRIRSHAELGNHLFWLDDASDEVLEKLYASASCLLAASYDEGFGLPLIEAARMGLPIIARDIPIFKEIVGDCALYFDGQAADTLASAVKHWLRLHEAGAVPDPLGISCQSWASTTSTIMEMLTDESHPNWLY